MFSNLVQGNILHGLDTRGDFKLFAAPITKTSAPYPSYIKNNGVQIPCMVVDISATINGENREFKQVPSNISIADFGSIGFILADSKDSLKVHVNSMVDTKKRAISNIELEKRLYEQYSTIADELNGTLAAKQENEELKALRAELAEYKNMMKEFINATKSGNN
jgi:uncharacterized coiled-coil protein SlyX